MLSIVNQILFDAIKDFETKKSEDQFSIFKKIDKSVYHHGEDKKTLFMYEINYWVPGSFVMSGQRLEDHNFTPKWTFVKEFDNNCQLFSSHDETFFGKKYTGHRLKITLVDGFKENTGYYIHSWMANYSKTIDSNYFRAHTWTDEACTESVILGQDTITTDTIWFTLDVVGPAHAFTEEAFREWLETPTLAANRTREAKSVKIRRAKPIEALFSALKKGL